MVEVLQILTLDPLVGFVAGAGAAQAALDRLDLFMDSKRIVHRIVLFVASYLFVWMRSSCLNFASIWQLTTTKIYLNYMNE
jgi:hypothetical protein